MPWPTLLASMEIGWDVKMKACRIVGRVLLLLSGVVGLLALPCSAADTWSPAHVVIVVLENRSFKQIVGDREMPYLNALASGGALMTRAYFAQTPYGIVPEGYESRLPARPSQPNYLYLFSGHHQGVLPSWFQAPGSPYLGNAINDAAGNRLPRPVPDTPVGIGNNLIPAGVASVHDAEPRCRAHRERQELRVVLGVAAVSALRRAGRPFADRRSVPAQAQPGHQLDRSVGPPRRGGQAEVPPARRGEPGVHEHDGPGRRQALSRLRGRCRGQAGSGSTGCRRCPSSCRTSSTTCTAPAKPRAMPGSQPTSSRTPTGRETTTACSS